MVGGCVFWCSVCSQVAVHRPPTESRLDASATSGEMKKVQSQSAGADQSGKAKPKI